MHHGLRKLAQSPHDLVVRYGRQGLTIDDAVESVPASRVRAGRDRAAELTRLRSGRGRRGLPRHPDAFVEDREHLWMDLLQALGDLPEVHLRLGDDAGEIAEVARLVGVEIHEHQMLEGCDRCGQTEEICGWRIDPSDERARSMMGCERAARVAFQELFSMPAHTPMR